MTTLEKIRAEILSLPTEKWNMVRRTRVLDIIDKYMAEQEPTDEWQNGYDMAWEEAKVFYEKEEPTSPCDLCRFNMDEFCEYLSDCPAMTKGGAE